MVLDSAVHSRLVRFGAQRGYTIVELATTATRPSTTTGSLQFDAKFDQLPKKVDGVIVVWHQPVTKKGIALERTRPAHAPGIDLLWKAPERFGLNPRAPINTLPSNFYGVTSGHYHVRGFWNKKLKSSNEINKDFWTRIGEHRVTEGTTVELKRGETATGEIVFKPLKRE